MPWAINSNMGCRAKITFLMLDHCMLFRLWESWEWSIGFWVNFVDPVRTSISQSLMSLIILSQLLLSISEHSCKTFQLHQSIDRQWAINTSPLIMCDWSVDSSLNLPGHICNAFCAMIHIAGIWLSLGYCDLQWLGQDIGFMHLFSKHVQSARVIWQYAGMWWFRSLCSPCRAIPTFILDIDGNLNPHLFTGSVRIFESGLNGMPRSSCTCTCWAIQCLQFWLACWFWRDPVHWLPMALYTIGLLPGIVSIKKSVILLSALIFSSCGCNMYVIVLLHCVTHSCENWKDSMHRVLFCRVSRVLAKM